MCGVCGVCGVQYYFGQQEIKCCDMAGTLGNAELCLIQYDKDQALRRMLAAGGTYLVEGEVCVGYRRTYECMAC